MASALIPKPKKQDTSRQDALLAQQEQRTQQAEARIAAQEQATKEQQAATSRARRGRVAGRASLITGTETGVTRKQLG